MCSCRCSAATSHRLVSPAPVSTSRLLLLSPATAAAASHLLHSLHPVQVHWFLSSFFWHLWFMLLAWICARSVALTIFIGESRVKAFSRSKRSWVFLPRTMASLTISSARDPYWQLFTKFQSPTTKSSTGSLIFCFLERNTNLSFEVFNFGW